MDAQAKPRGRRKSRKRQGRPINGILVLDKPQGMTSNAALQEVKSIFNASKAGHTVSLDPLATGVLPICFGEMILNMKMNCNFYKKRLSTFKA